MKKILLASIMCLSLAGCDDFLTKEPLASFQDDDFWSSENNVRGFAFGYYADRFPGYGNGDTGGVMLQRQALNDDFTNINLPGFNAQPTNKGGLWGTYFTKIRRDNIFVDRVERVPFTDEASANHWRGIARFFRAFDYSQFAFSFKHVPYYDHELTSESSDLFRPQDDVFYVMDRVLEDYKYASENVYKHDTKTGADGLVITRDVVDAFMSRHMLMMGTKLKYDPATTAGQTEKVVIYLQAAKDAAWRVISSGSWNLASNYHDLFTTIDITSAADVKQEMILYRQYATGMVTHAIMTYDRDETIQGYCAPKDLIDSYLCTNGLPIHLASGTNTYYQGDKTAEQQMANRDPRLSQTFRTKFYTQYGETVGYAHSGFKRWKFLNEPTKDDTEATQSFNVTDAPVIRLGEVMMNYIEAAAELADMGEYTVTQVDLDATINKLRKRASYGKFETLQIIDGKPAVNGVVYDDADRDSDVPSFIWEVRRERRVELVYEGFRLNDLKRWRKLEYMNTDLYPEKNMGCYMTKSEQYKNLILCDESGSIISNAGNATGSGYLKVSVTPRNSENGYVLDRNYWECIPLYEIDYYEQNGSHLTQNPGWPQGGAE